MRRGCSRQKKPETMEPLGVRRTLVRFPLFSRDLSVVRLAMDLPLGRVSHPAAHVLVDVMEYQVCLHYDHTKGPVRHCFGRTGCRSDGRENAVSTFRRLRMRSGVVAMIRRPPGRGRIMLKKLCGICLGIKNKELESSTAVADRA